MAKKDERLVLGLVEIVTLEDGKKYKAKIDTGADSSSIDESLVFKLGSKEVTGHKTIRSALGKMRRPMIVIDIELQGKVFHEKISVADRRHMKYKILIGKDILKKEGFLIDPNK